MNAHLDQLQNSADHRFSQGVLTEEGKGNTMHKERQERIRAEMKARGIDCLALFIGYSLYYFTGLKMLAHERPMLFVISRDEENAILLPNIEASSAQAIMTEPCNLFPFTDEAGFEHIFADMSKRLKLSGKTVGIEFLGMRIQEYELIKRHAPGVTFVDATDAIAELRMCKSEEELDKMRKAAEITEKALMAALPVIRPGATERDVFRELQAQMLKFGSGQLWKQPMVTSGPRTAFPHSKVSDRVIESGDLVMIDTGANYGEYICDLTRTFAVEKVEDEFRKIYDIVREANAAVEKIKRPDVSAEEVDLTGRAVIESRGYGKYFFNRLGHGLGLEGHEPPYIVRGNKLKLRAGMTFTDEPGIYILGRGGVRVEDDVVFTGKGIEYLTSFPRELMVLG